MVRACVQAVTTPRHIRSCNEARVGTHQTESEIAAYLLHRYGPRLDYKQVAEVLGVSPRTLRWALYRKHKSQHHIQVLHAKKRKIGRKVHWLPVDVAPLLSGDRP